MAERAKPTKRLRSGEMRAELVRFAEDLCAEVGPNQVRLREIARNAGIAAPSIYNHFKSLDDLLSAVVESFFVELENVFLGTDEMPADQAMDFLCHKNLALFAARSGAARLILFDFSSPGGTKSMAMQEHNINNAIQSEAKIIKRGITAGLFREVPTSEATMARVGMSLTLLSEFWIENKEIKEGDMTRMGKIVSEFVLRYLAI